MTVGTTKQIRQLMRKFNIGNSHKYATAQSVHHLAVIIGIKLKCTTWYLWISISETCTEVKCLSRETTRIHMINMDVSMTFLNCYNFVVYVGPGLNCVKPYCHQLSLVL